MLLESEYMCREGTRLQTEMCTIDTYTQFKHSRSILLTPVVVDLHTMFLVGSVKYMCICGSERRQYHEVWILHLSLHRLRREGRGEGRRKGGRKEGREGE